MRQHSRSYETVVHRVWERYATFVRNCTPGTPSPQFRDSGYVIGSLTPATVERIDRAIRRAPCALFRQDDWSPGYRWIAKAHKIAARLNAGHRYYDSTPEVRDAIHVAITELVDPVRDAIGSRWSVAAARVIETLPTAEQMGPNAWHGDGMPPDILKVMIYISAPGRDAGTTELLLRDEATLLVEGAPGTWMLFKNSEIVHRGIAPTAISRLAVEITLVPSLWQRTVPVFPGSNVSYPEHPGWRSPVARWFWRILVSDRPDERGPTGPRAAAPRPLGR